MEPSSEVKKVTVEDARAKGMERINKLLNFIAPAFAPGLLVKAELNAAQEKWEKSERKKQVDAFVEKAADAADRLGRRWERTKRKTGAIAREQGKRAAAFGLRQVGVGERFVQWISADLPAMVQDFKGGLDERKADKLRESLKKVRESSEKAREKAGEHRARGKKMNAVRKLAESLQTKG